MCSAVLYIQYIQYILYIHTYIQYRTVLNCTVSKLRLLWTGAR